MSRVMPVLLESMRDSGNEIPAVYFAVALKF